MDTCPPKQSHTHAHKHFQLSKILSCNCLYSIHTLYPPPRGFEPRASCLLRKLSVTELSQPPATTVFFLLRQGLRNLPKLPLNLPHRNSLPQVSASPALGLQIHTTMPAFCVGAGEPNSDPHAYEATLHQLSHPPGLR